MEQKPQKPGCGWMDIEEGLKGVDGGLAGGFSE